MQGKVLHYSFNTHIKNIGFVTSDILFEEAVLTAAARGDLASIKFFLNCSRDEAVFGEAMRIAASNGHGDIVDAIVQEYGKSLDLRSPIVSAAADGQTRILVKLLNLVEQFPPMCLKEALTCAAAKGKVASVAVLLGTRYRHLTDPAKALVTAALSGRANVIKLFLDTGVYDTEALGRSLVEAVRSGDEKSADLLIKNQTAVEFGGVEALKEATNKGLFDIVLKLLVRGVEVDDIELLTIAARRGHLKLVKYFFLCFRLYRPDVPHYKTIALDAASSFNNEGMRNFILTDMNERIEFCEPQKFLD